MSKPDLGGNEEKYVVDAIRSSWISSTGYYVDRFEREFAERCGAATKAVSCCNGTVALHLALLALGVQPGDEVIVPAMTFVATANAVRYCGAIPVIVDVDEDTWCIDPAAVREALSERTKGVIAVHLFGHPADMVELRDIADGNNLWIVEDAAQAHFARHGTMPVGSLGDLATFSFYGNKVITSGEGGAVVDPTGRYSEKLRLLRGQGMDPNRRYYHPIIGYNYRLTNVACAILCAQLERADDLVVQRHRVRRRYWDAFIGWDEEPQSTVVMQKYARNVSPVPWMVGVVLSDVNARARAEAALSAAGVQTRPFFVPLSRLPPHRCRVIMSVADKLYGCGLCLPTYPGLPFADIDRIAACVIEAAQ